MATTPRPAQRRRRWPRVLVGALACLSLVVATLGALAVARVPQDDVRPLPVGRVTLAPGVDATAIDVAGMRFTWAPGDAGALTVTDAGSGRVVLSTAPGSAFVQAGVGALEWRESRGYFWVTTTRAERLVDQTVERVEVRRTNGGVPASVAVSGTVRGDGAEAPYTLVLEPLMRASIPTLHVDLKIPGNVKLPGGGTTLATSVAFAHARGEGEGVHGFGVTYGPWDLAGRVLPIVVREQGVGRGEQPLSLLADVTNDGAAGNWSTTYGAYPAYVTDAVRGVRLAGVENSYAFALADLTVPAQVRLEWWSQRLAANVTVAENPRALLAGQGPPVGGTRPALPGWLFDGAVLGLQGGTDVVSRRVDELLAAGTKVSAIWLQDWTGQRTTSFGQRLWWTWQLDQDRYPGWDRMVAGWRAKGIRTLTCVNTWLVDPTLQPGFSGRSLYREARDAGYLVRRPDGSPYWQDQGGFEAVLVDLTNPKAFEWYADVIATQVLRDGVEGFMADFGEGLPFDAVLHNGKPATAHNLWPYAWAKTVRRGCEKAGRPDCVAFARSASLGSGDVVPLQWAGDQMVDFAEQDGMASVPQAAFAAGVSGIPLMHSDVGGYTSVNAVVRDYVRPPDLLARWAEMEAFGVVLRTHEGNRPAQNEQVYSTDRTRAQFARMSRVYTALATYRKTVVEDAQRTGVPAIRHVWVNHPGTAAATSPESATEFMLGSDVLVAPVVSQGAVDVSVAFPPGRWRHLITGEQFDGDRTVRVAAPVGTPAAFVRVDAPGATALAAAVRAAAGPA